MTNPAIAKAVNEQINKELEAWYNYLAMAAWFHTLNLSGFANFFDAQSREEQAHAQKLIQYVLDRGWDLELAAVAAPKRSYDSIIEVFETAMAQEQSNTREFYELYELSREHRDFATSTMLQWFLDEQVEEEKLMSESLGLVQFAGEDKSALLALNRDFGQRKEAAIDSDGGPADEA